MNYFIKHLFQTNMPSTVKMGWNSVLNYRLKIKNFPSVKLDYHKLNVPSPSWSNESTSFSQTPNFLAVLRVWQFMQKPFQFWGSYHSPILFSIIFLMCQFSIYCLSVSNPPFFGLLRDTGRDDRNISPLLAGIMLGLFVYFSIAGT